MDSIGRTDQSFERLKKNFLPVFGRKNDAQLQRRIIGCRRRIRGNRGILFDGTNLRKKGGLGG